MTVNTTIAPASSRITINNRDMSVVEYGGQRVVTLAMIDEVHQRPEGTAGRNFRENRTRFVEGEDYVSVRADEIRRNKIYEISANTHRDITLFTESGYLMLVKSFTDDLAWQVQRQLVRSYFRNAPATPQPATIIPPEAVALYQTLTNVGMTAHGMTRKRAVTFANEAVVERYGIDFMGMMGIPKAVGVMRDLESVEPTSQFPEVLEALASTFGVGGKRFTTARIITHRDTRGIIDRVLGDHIRDRDGYLCARRLGKYLLNNCARREGGICLVSPGLGRDKVRLWAIDRFAQEAAR
ncbi:MULTISPECIES: ORF6N domain-containing protein [Asaia]|uniref:ORF6N domain-containing protein n=1 Tax=Asaia TaxID=91914 RepID=UPI002FC3478E